MSAAASRALCRSYFAHLALGAETIDGPGFRVVRRLDAPLIYDLNHVQAPGEVDADALFEQFARTLGGLAHRCVFTTPETSPRLVARLAHDDYRPDSTLQMRLEGELRGPAPEAHDIRPVERAADWQALDRLVRADHVEQDRKQGTAVYTEAVTAQIQAVRRAVADAIHFFLAWLDGEPVGFFSSWPGAEGKEGIGRVGMVEDLFTLPSHRGRGVARALIHHCVADARRRGAESVLIGAEPEDTPKRIYAALGFEPTCLTTSWVKRDDSEGTRRGLPG